LDRSKVEKYEFTDICEFFCYALLADMRFQTWLPRWTKVEEGCLRMPRIVA